MGDGLFNKLKVLVGIEEIPDNEDYIDEIEEVEIRAVEQKKSESKNSSYASTSKNDSRVVNMQAVNNKSQFKMVVIEPKGFEECPRLVDNLKARKPVIINLEKNNADVARKIFDFLSGATYALNGNVQRVANNIFIFAPENVDVAANIDNRSANLDEILKSPWK